MHSGGKETGSTAVGKEKNGELNTYAGQDEHKRVVWGCKPRGEKHGSLSHGTMVDTLLLIKGRL